MTIRILPSALTAIRDHVCAMPHEEVCGLIFGTPDRIDAAHPARNVHPHPARHFEIDPAALFAAIRAERTGGPALIGYYHSHPNGRAEPSATDIACAAPDGRIWLIAAAGEVTAWRARQGSFEPVPMIAALRRDSASATGAA